MELWLKLLSANSPTNSTNEAAMYFDSFDICQAHYTFAALFHGGQWCPIYAKFAQLDRLRFRPGMGCGNPANLEANAKAIYRQLVVKHCGLWSTISNPRKF
jgi:hypothetical protein